MADRRVTAEPLPSARRQRPWSRTILDWVVFVLCLGGLWFVAAPTSLGGPTSYVIVDGSSMEPTYRDGDLVIAREQSEYRIGDVVTYRPEVGRQPFPVIHRIVAVTADGQYLTQGDNRAEPDEWSATSDNIVGASWVHVPFGGEVIRFLRQPVPWLALATAFFTLAALTRREERRGEPLAEAP